MDKRTLAAIREIDDAISMAAAEGDTMNVLRLESFKSRVHDANSMLLLSLTGNAWRFRIENARRIMGHI